MAETSQLRTLRIPCAQPPLAEKFAAYLRSEGIDVDGTEGREVLIPWGGNVRFALDVAEVAFDGGYANDGEPMAAAIRQVEEVSRG